MQAEVSQYGSKVSLPARASGVVSSGMLVRLIGAHGTGKALIGD